MNERLHALLLTQALTEPNAAVRSLLLEQADAALLPIADQVAGWPDALRHREAGLAATNAQHAAFLGPEIVQALARHEAADVAMQEALRAAGRREA